MSCDEILGLKNDNIKGGVLDDFIHALVLIIDHMCTVTNDENLSYKSSYTFNISYSMCYSLTPSGLETRSIN